LISRGVTSFFDTVIKPSQGRRNSDGTKNFRAALLHYHNDQNVFGIYEELKDLGERILTAANFVYQDVMNHDTELRITNVWFNECGAGGRQLMHNHCNSVLSSTLYLRTDERSHVQFQSPYRLNDFGNLLLDEPNTKRPNRFGYGHHFKRHGYAENLTPGRLSLSFNLLPTTFNCVYKT